MGSTGICKDGKPRVVMGTDENATADDAVGVWDAVADPSAAVAVMECLFEV